MLFVLWGTENIHCRRGRKKLYKGGAEADDFSAER